MNRHDRIARVLFAREQKVDAQRRKRLLGLPDVARKLHFHRNVLLSLHKLQHGEEILHAAVQFAP